MYYKEYQVDAKKTKNESNFTNKILVVKSELPLSEFFYGEKRYEIIKIDNHKFLKTTADLTHIKKFCKKIDKEQAKKINPEIAKL